MRLLVRWAYVELIMVVWRTAKRVNKDSKYVIEWAETKAKNKITEQTK